MRRLAATIVLLACLPCLCPPCPAVDINGKKMEVYSVGIGDYDLILETAKSMASPEGKVIGDAAGRRIIVVDKPEVHDQVRQLINIMQVPPQNVRIKVRFDNQGSSTHQGLGVGGTAKFGNVVVTTDGRKEGVRVNADDEYTRSSSMTQQELLVVNNGTASLNVTRELPYYEWIFNYGIAEGYWTAQTRWKSVGAKLQIKPTIIGNTIKIKLTPELSTVTDKETLAIAMETLSTEVIAQNGQEVSLGGLPADRQEFYRKFLVGFDEHRRERSLNIRLTPTIEEINLGK